MKTIVKKKKILIVDDELVMSDMFKSLLELEGFVCFTANDVPTAMALVIKIKPDLIISDIMMPEIDGFEFRKQLLQNKELQNIPFVFLTSNSSETFLLKGYNLDIENYIPKTTSLTIVIKKVESIFQSAAKNELATVNELTNAAKKVRTELMPDTVPQLPNLEISQIHVPYKGIPGGDFIDYISFNDDLHAIVVADIMGKEWNAWFVKFAYVSYLRSAIRYKIENSTKNDPAEVLEFVNECLLHDTNLTNYFITVSLIILDSKNNTILYSGAGDLPLIQKTQNSEIILHQSEGINLGLKENGYYNTIEIKMQKGDSFLIYTDGLIEATDKNNEQFGLEGLINTLENKPEVILGDIFDTVKDFAEEEIDDDLTMIAIKHI